MLKVKQCAERLNCSIATVYALCESGKLPSVKIGANGGGVRILEDDLLAFIEASRTVPAGRSPKPNNVRLKHVRI